MGRVVYVKEGCLAQSGQGGHSWRDIKRSDLLDIYRTLAEAGSPIVNLKILPGHVVSLNTRERYDRIMKLYELGGWSHRGKLATSIPSFFDEFGSDTFVSCDNREISYGSISVPELLKGRTPIGSSEFCKRQRLSVKDLAIYVAMWDIANSLKSK